MLKCHYCEYQVSLPQTCPTCQSTHLKKIGFGTQKIEEEIENTFHGAKVIRYDVDTTKNKNGHLKLLDAFQKQEGNILLGTQMIAKGLDFENVTFVGVLSADLSLTIPDFRANERTFQLLSQVSGRSGRGQKEGSVVIQTFNPDHYAITLAARHDYKAFFKEEMQFRKSAVYPPYCYMLAIIIQSKNEAQVKECALEIKYYLQTHLHNVSILGPANSAIYKMQDLYRQRITVKYVDFQQIYTALEVINDFYNKQKHGKVTVVCDFNPYTQI